MLLTNIMTFQEYKSVYWAMPAKYRKHGDMPTTYEIYDDVDAYHIARAKVINTEV